MPASIRSRWLRRALLALAALLVFVLGWYAALRLTSPWRRVKVVSPGGPEAAAGGAAPAELRVGAYNVAHGRGLAAGNWSGGGARERAERLRAIGRLLVAEKLDIVVLNEVDFDCSWSGRTNQAEAIAREAGLPFRAEGRNLDLALPGLAWRFGNAVLSRHPIVKAEIVDYPAYSRFEALAAGKKRGLLCTVELGAGRRVRVLAVHLEHRSEAVRQAAARSILALGAGSDPPLVAAGDFNSTLPGWPGAHPDAAGRTALSLLLEDGGLAAAVSKTPEASGFTFPSDAPRRTIDWVLAPPGWALSAQRALDSRLSDHRPVVAVLAVPVK